jgi:acetyl esterase/lipase
MLRRARIGVIAAIVILASGVYAAFQLSPWPSVWLIRHSFDKGAADAAAAIAPLVPKDVMARRGLNYAKGDGDALLDVFAPGQAKGALPAIIWVHGGGFISGSRQDLSGYLQVLAAQGFVAVAVDYTVAPEAQFPTPLRQTNAALSYIIANAGHFNIDPQRIFLAGDSAGAQIVAQTALAVSDAAYAKSLGIAPGMARSQLRGLILFCGPYEPGALNFEGSFGGFMRTVIWAYVGTKDPRDPRVAQIAVTPHISANYPPVFISAGNADPLAPQSMALAAAARAQGIETDTLFFPKDHNPPLPHEYQMLLSTEAGQLAFSRAVAFLKAHSN